MVLFALLVFVFVGVLALSLDAGYLMGERRHAQSTADAAALAAARHWMTGADASDAAADGIAYIEANGIALSGASAAIASIDPDGTSRAGTVTVDLDVPVTRFFVGAIYTGDWGVSAHAVARIFDDKNGNYALLALEPPGMYVNGDITLDIVGGGAMSNGDVARSGGVNAFTVDTTIDAVGEVDPNDLWEAPGGFNGKWAEATDPLAGAIPPSAGVLTPIEADDLPDCWTASCTLQPGYYANLGEIRIKYTATLMPGPYYFTGTSLELNNTNSRIEGDGVLLYFAGSPANTYFNPKTGGVRLIAPATSPYSGGPDHMVVWIANCAEFDSQGNEEFYIEGIFYAPCSDVTMHGNPGGTAVSGQVIVGTLDVRGTSDFQMVYQDLVAIPRIEVYLVE
jgi:hypothetical protein